MAAELSLALVDRSLLRLYRDRLPTIGPFFYDQTRTAAFATESTDTFRYQPATVPVPEAVVEERRSRWRSCRRGQARRRRGRQAGSVRLRGPDGRPRRPRRPRPAWPAGAAWAEGMARSGSPRPDMALSTRSDSRDGADAEPRSQRTSPASELEARSQPVDTFEIARGSLEGRRGHPPRGDQLGRRLRKRRAGRWGKEAGRAAGPPRQRFVETAYWNPSVVTGTDGKALVTFRAPAALSEYRFTARGVIRPRHARRPGHGRPRGAEGLLRRPEGARRADPGRQAPVLGRVHHRGVAGTLALRLTIYAGGREQVYPEDGSTSRPTASSDVLFDPFEVPDGDDVRLTLAATPGEANDELTVAVPIRPWGVQAFASASGTSTDDTTAFVGLPPGPAVRAARDAHRDLADRAADADRAGPGRGRLPDRGPLGRSASRRPPRHHGRPRRRPARGGVRADLPAIDQGDGRPRPSA